MTWGEFIMRVLNTQRHRVVDPEVERAYWERVKAEKEKPKVVPKAGKS